MSKTISLSQPIKGHNGEQIGSVTLREPKYRDYMDLGLPVTWVTINAEGGGFEQEAASLIGAWIERLADIDPNFLELLSLADSLELRDAVIGFFREARARKAPKSSTNSGASSSSGSDSTREPSKI